MSRWTHKIPVRITCRSTRVQDLQKEATQRADRHTNASVDPTEFNVYRTLSCSFVVDPEVHWRKNTAKVAELSNMIQKGHPSDAVALCCGLRGFYGRLEARGAANTGLGSVTRLSCRTTRGGLRSICQRGPPSRAIRGCEAAWCRTAGAVGPEAGFESQMCSGTKKLC